MQLYKTAIRPLLFRFPPEYAQGMADSILKLPCFSRAISPFFDYGDSRLEVSAGNLTYPSPVGIAAGYDKDCRFLDRLMSLGFGYVVGGTVTLEPRPGNPSPRLLRLPSKNALINALGFPGKGLIIAKENLERIQNSRSNKAKPVIVSVSGLSIEEIAQCHGTLEPLVDAIEVNISSPNTEGIRVFQKPEKFKELLQTLNEERVKPLFVKMPPYTSEEGRENVLTLVRIALKEGIDAITASNTHPITDIKLAVGRGGLSGQPLLQDTIRIVQEIRLEVGKDVAISACGGIFTYLDAIRAIRAGADTVQLFTGLVYEGPSVAKNMNLGLIKYMNQKGIQSIRELAKPEA